jgi:hypothetical protein
MTDTNGKTGFKTDAFIGALEENDEMNKNGKVKKKGAVPGGKGKKERFTTDAFSEALKVNEEMNKK